MMRIFAIPTNNNTGPWEHSSVGSERLPYKQRVGGSNPSAPTSRGMAKAVPLFFYTFRRPPVWRAAERILGSD